MDNYKVYTPTITPINVKLFTFDNDKLKSDANIREKTLRLVMANMKQSSKQALLRSAWFAKTSHDSVSYDMAMFMESSNASPIGFGLQMSNATSATSTNSAYFGTITTNDLVLMTANTRRVTVTSVSINTGSPSALLDVSGSVSSTLDIAGSGVAYFLKSGGIVSTIGPLSSIAVSVKAANAILAGAGFYTTS
ncbi:unnamed protein product [Phytophthora lilii]|uniref:Unnamed protein product n=1 Tax=Phytophthora lilii TaxID=2077276 RepID=A0A9W6TK45_9STRA|nr:unnamed protein product [Phytophthora lilii]